MKHVRGSPAYFQQTFYNVLGMIRQLHIPTWFLTLSAADMKWPDVIQCIAYQYGETLTEEQVKNMTSRKKQMASIESCHSSSSLSLSAQHILSEVS